LRQNFNIGSAGFFFVSFRQKSTLQAAARFLIAPHPWLDVLLVIHPRFAMRAAGAVGDDNLERQTHGYVVPDSFTHGISEQRVPWFRKGYETGDTSQGDTFRASEL
jgi:hypothetical protein